MLRRNSREDDRFGMNFLKLRHPWNADAKCVCRSSKRCRCRRDVKDTTMRTIGLTAAVMMGLGLLPGRADAADPHIDDLAFTLRNQAAQACKEARYHFR